MRVGDNGIRVRIHWQFNWKIKIILARPAVKFEACTSGLYAVLNSNSRAPSMHAVGPWPRRISKNKITIPRRDRC